MPRFDIPDDFRAFMQEVVAYLDAPGGDKLLDGEDALKHDVGYGGRIDPETYRFCYLTHDGQGRWELVVDEGLIRSIAQGLVIELEGEHHENVRTTPRVATGEPLMIWGEYGDDALHVHDQGELVAALDAFWTSASEAPRMLRLWSATDDQIVAVVWRDDCALYVIVSPDGYATSTGDLSRTDSFELRDHDGQPLVVPRAECIPWDRARNALLQFLTHGNLGPEIRIEGRIPSVLLMMGDIDRAAALAGRGEAPRSLARSSLPRMAVPEVISEQDDLTAPVAIEPVMKVEELSDWARRVVQLLSSRELIEIEGNLDEISYQLGSMLQTHAVDAEHSIETAEWLANELGAVRGVTKLFATGGDLQLALRRSRTGD